MHGDKSAFSPGGVRLGSAALTTRGFGSEDFRQVAQLLHQAAQLALRIQALAEASSGRLLKDFLASIGPVDLEAIEGLRKQVEALALSFPMPGANMGQ